MEESLKNLFAETMNLIKRYGTCLLKDPNINVKELEDLSSCMMNICDENLIQDVTFKTLKSFKQEIFPEFLNNPDNVEDESVIFQFQNEVQHAYDKLDLGKNNNTYKEFEEAVLSKIPKKNLEHDITAVSENLNLVDPITKLPLTDPVKNLICGHVYEKDVIMHLLNNKKHVKCPIPGCVAANKITKKDLVRDTTVQKYLQDNP